MTTKPPPSSMRSQARPLPTILAIAIAALALATSLTACGSSSKKPSSSSSAATDSASSAPDPASTTPAPEIPEDPKGPVATVAGKPISFQSLSHWMAIEADSKAKVPDPPSFGKCIASLEASAGKGQSAASLKLACQKRYVQLQQDALGSLIQAQWLTDEAAESGWKVNQGEVQHEYDESLKANGASLTEQLAATGETLSELRQGLVIQQLSDDLYERVKRETPKLTHARIARYYQEHKASYAMPQLRDLHIVRTQSEASAEQVRRQIQAGQSFASVVKQVASVPQPIDSHEGLLLGLAPKFFTEPVLAKANLRRAPEGPHGARTHQPRLLRL
jgi:hypothetical protein